MYIAMLFSQICLKTGTFVLKLKFLSLAIAFLPIEEIIKVLPHKGFEAIIS